MPNTFTDPKPVPELSLDPPVQYIDIFVKEIEKVLLLYDRIEIWRSEDNVTYTELTADDDYPAFIQGTSPGPFNISGKSLGISKNDSPPLIITFGGVDPVDLQTILDTVNLVFSGPNYKCATEVPTNTNKLQLQSDIKGLSSNIQVSGTAVADFGLITTRIYGKTHRPILTNPTIRYRFYDTSAIIGTTYYYKYRYSHSITKRVSSFSEYILVDPIQIMSSTVNCYIRLADNRGYPVRGRRIVLHIINPSVFGTTPTINQPLVGIMDQRIEMITDQFGKAITKVPINTYLKVYIENSLINRLLNTGQVDFDLLDKLSLTYDPFNVVFQDPLIPIISIS
jgi:hypothetical protein